MAAVVNRTVSSNLPAEIGDYPSNLEVETTRICNVFPFCKFCFKNTDVQWLGRDTHISDKILGNLANAIRHAESLSFHGVGEVFTYPRLFEVIGWARPTAIVWFISNGLLLKDEQVSRLNATEQVKGVTISVDAAKRATYERLRHADFDVVIRNIENLIAKRRSSLPVRLSFTIVRDNILDVVEFVRLAARLGVDGVYFSPLAVTDRQQKVGSWDYHDQENIDPKLHDLMISAAISTAESLRIPLDVQLVRRLASRGFFAQESIYESCDLPFKSAHVTTDGKVTTCCWSQAVIGDLNEQSFDDIWKGARFEDVREAFRRGTFHQGCLGTHNVCPFRIRKYLFTNP